MIINNTYIGYIAGVFTAFAAIPQIIKVYRTKNVDGLSLLTLVIFFIGQILWLIHGYYNNDDALMVFSIITALFYIALIYAKKQF